MSKLLVRFLVYSAACCALSFGAVASSSSNLQTLTIFVKGAPVSMPVVEREVARLMEPTGFAVVFKDMADRRAGEDFANLATVNFQGSCDVSAALPPLGSRLETGALASTAVSDGQILPFATVRCDVLRKVLAPALSNVRGEGRSAMFGRAAARVLAHELYHMLAKAKGHGSHGVSKSCFGLADLTAESFHFDAETVAQMRPPQAGWFEDTEADEPSGR